MKTYLLKDVSTEEVSHMIQLRKEAPTEEIQDFINRKTDEFFELEENGWVGLECQGEFVINALLIEYDGEELTYEEDEVLYY